MDGTQMAVISHDGTREIHRYKAYATRAGKPDD